MTRKYPALRRQIPLPALAALAAIALNASVASAQSPPGASQTFAVLGATTVTNTGLTTITGNVGVSPGTAITGFPPGVVREGAIHAGDAVAAAAHGDAGVEYARLRAMQCLPANNLTGQVLGVGVLSLPPGVYCFNSSAQLTGILFLTGPGPWVFQMRSTLTTASLSQVVVVDPGANCSGSNVFWQVGSSATLGTGTEFVGNILANTSITLTTNATVSGSAIALTGAVTMDTNMVSVCNAGPVVIPPVEDDCKDHHDGDDHDGDHDGKDHHDGDHHDGDHDGHHGDKDHDGDHDGHHGDKDHDGDHDGHHGDKDKCHDHDKDHKDKDHDKDHKDKDGKDGKDKDHKGSDNKDNDRKDKKG